MCAWLADFPAAHYKASRRMTSRPETVDVWLNAMLQDVAQRPSEQDVEVA